MMKYPEVEIEKSGFRVDEKETGCGIKYSVFRLKVKALGNSTFKPRSSVYKTQKSFFYVLWQLDN